MARSLTALAFCGVATALVARRSPLAVPRRNFVAKNRIAMEDFGFMKGTVFSFKDEWGKEDCISEVKVEKYMNEQGLRFKMNKTAKERENLKLGGGVFPEFSFTIPLLNVDVNIAPPQTESIWEAFGFTATSNNAARQEEKKKAIKKEEEAYSKYGDLVSYWKEKYGYTKYVPGSWFYADQLTTDDEELRSTSGFRMRKGGFYLDGTRDTRK